MAGWRVIHQPQDPVSAFESANVGQCWLSRTIADMVAISCSLSNLTYKKIEQGVFWEIQGIKKFSQWNEYRVSCNLPALAYFLLSPLQESKKD